MTDTDVTIVVITKNESEVIEACLGSIFNQSVKPQEVIVVDGRSKDDTLEKARKFPVKIIVETGHTSPSNARNLGVKEAKSDIVLVMGADAMLDKDCIKNAVEYFNNPSTIVVVPTLEIRVHTRLEKIQKNWFYGTRSRFRTPYGTGSSIQFIRKDVYNSIKFDSSLGFGDDSDFRRKVIKLCGPEGIISADKSKIFVDLPHSFSEMSSQYMWYGRTSLKYYARYHSLDSIVRLSSLLGPFVLIILLVITGVSARTAVFPFLVYLLIVGLALIVARNVIICIRSRSVYFFEFLLFDFARSFLYVWGVAQGFFVKKTGR